MPSLERRPEDWTPGRGLVRAAASLGLRSLVFVPAWALLAWWAMPFLDRGTGIRALVLLAVAGYVVGQVYGRGVTARAGFVSVLVTVTASAACLVALSVAVGAAAVLGPMSGSAASMAIGCPWLFGTLAIVQITLFDD